MATATTSDAQVGVVYSHINTPMAVALLFGLAGAVFIAIYIIRRIRQKNRNL